MFMSDLVHNQFLGLASVGKDRADVRILPIPFEKTVTYGCGTSSGPMAILDASLQVEYFDEETLVDFQQSPKLYPFPALLDNEAETVEDYLDILQKRVMPLRDKFLFGLGGEHTITYGIVKGLVDNASEVTVVQIDAHADLIDELDQVRWSHGTVMRRLWEQGCRKTQPSIPRRICSHHDGWACHERITTYF